MASMDHPLVIRNAEKRDVAVLSEFAKMTYSHAFGHSFLDSDLAFHLANHLSAVNFSEILANDIVLLAEIENRLVGFVQFGAAPTSFDRKVQELRRLYVHPEFQNRSYGSALMEAALRHPQLQRADRIILDVWEHNHGALRFYRRYGFEVIGTRSFEVESGAETSLDLIMERRSQSEG